MNGSNALRLMAAVLLVSSLVTATARADLISGYTTGVGSQLLAANGGAGSILFTDTAAPGGNQDPVVPGGATFNSALLPGAGLWALGDTVTITGVALVLKGNDMGSGNFTFNIREGAGGTGESGAADLALLGSATAAYTTTSTIETLFVNFDTPITFTVDAHSTTIGINFAFDGGSVAYKAGTDLGGSGGLVRYNYDNGNIVGGLVNTSYQRWSVAGVVVPEPGSAVLLGLGVLGLALRRQMRT